MRSFVFRVAWSVILTLLLGFLAGLLRGLDRLVGGKWNCELDSEKVRQSLFALMVAFARIGGGLFQRKL